MTPHTRVGYDAFDQPLVRDGERDLLGSDVALGTPLLRSEPRTSDALRFFEEPELRAAAVAAVADAGGAAFFERPDWEPRLRALVAARSVRGRLETGDEQQAAIRHELAEARRAIAERTGRPVVHLCYPWHVAGRVARRLAAEAGYETAFCGKVRGVPITRPGGDPLAIARLGEDYVELLPGSGRGSLPELLRRKWTRRFSRPTSVRWWLPEMSPATAAAPAADPSLRPAPAGGTLLLPVLPLDDVCLLPGASLTLVLDKPATIAAVRLATRTGDRLLAVARREAGGRELHVVGTVAEVRGLQELAPLEQRVELEGVLRARVALLVGADMLVAEVVPLLEGEAREEWGAAVEALARYLYSHAELRSFLDKQPRSSDAMAWVNLACQHLPITASARQKLLEANAAERCLKISRGLDALLKKEQA